MSSKCHTWWTENNYVNKQASKSWGGGEGGHSQNNQQHVATGLLSRTAKYCSLCVWHFKSVSVSVYKIFILYE